MTPTWIVWSPTPPECREKISCTSMLDAARAWAERQFRRSILARSGMEVLVRCANDPVLMSRIPANETRPASALPDAVTATIYRVKITIVNAPAFRASLLGVAYEGDGVEPKGSGRG